MNPNEAGAAAPAPATATVPARTAVASDGVAAPQAAAAPGARGRPVPPDVYVYAVSGIAERKGRIPVWLWLVALGLTVWGIYYLIAYWNPPPGS
jgi:hypothetical protein